MRKKTIIFDLDGTLMDSLQDLTLSVNYCMAKYGGPQYTDEEIKEKVGRGIYVLIEKSLPGGRSNPDYDACVGEFAPYYQEHMFDHSCAFPGIPEVLEALKNKGCHLAIVSNKFDAAVKEISGRFFGDLIEVAIGEAEKQGIRKKPAPDTVFEAMKQLGSEAEDCVYVGDSEVDLQTAANAHIPCISVTWGYKSEQFLKENGAKTIVSEPAGLLEVLC